MSATPQFVMFIMDEVRVDLKLTPEQSKKIDQILDPVIQNGPGGRKGIRLNQGDEVESLDARVLRVLNKRQRERLKQIWIQREGGLALSTSSVAKEVGLNSDQKSKISSLIADMHEEMKQAAMNSGEGRLRGAEAREATGKKIVALLAPEQSKKWASMQGPKFDFKKK